MGNILRDLGPWLSRIEMIFHLFFVGRLLEFSLVMRKSTELTILAFSATQDGFTILCAEVQRMVCLFCSSQTRVVWEVGYSVRVASFVGALSMIPRTLGPVMPKLLQARTYLIPACETMECWPEDRHNSHEVQKYTVPRSDLFRYTHHIYDKVNKKNSTHLVSHVRTVITTIFKKFEVEYPDVLHPHVSNILSDVACSEVQ